MTRVTRAALIDWHDFLIFSAPICSASDTSDTTTYLHRLMRACAYVLQWELRVTRHSNFVSYDFLNHLQRVTRFLAHFLKSIPVVMIF